MTNTNTHNGWKHYIELRCGLWTYNTHKKGLKLLNWMWPATIQGFTVRAVWLPQALKKKTQIFDYYWIAWADSMEIKLNIDDIYVSFVVRLFIWTTKTTSETSWKCNFPRFFSQEKNGCVATVFVHCFQRIIFQSHCWADETKIFHIFMENCTARQPGEEKKTQRTRQQTSMDALLWPTFHCRFRQYPQFPVVYPNFYAVPWYAMQHFPSYIMQEYEWTGRNMFFNISLAQPWPKKKMGEVASSIEQTQHFSLRLCVFDGQHPDSLDGCLGGPWDMEKGVWTKQIVAENYATCYIWQWRKAKASLACAIYIPQQTCAVRTTIPKWRPTPYLRGCQIVSTPQI